MRQSIKRLAFFDPMFDIRPFLKVSNIAHISRMAFWYGSVLLSGATCRKELGRPMFANRVGSEWRENARTDCYDTRGYRWTATESGMRQ